MTFKEAAKLILKEIGKPLKVEFIAEEAWKRGLISKKGETPRNTMSAVITTDINNKGPLSDFVRTAPGTYALNDKKEAVVEETKADQINEELNREEEVEVEGGYIGKAGEHAVLSELLFRGYNAALMAVDVGVDILARKENEVFNIQIKTRNISRTHESFFFNLRIAAFERHRSGRTFYIFVLLENKKVDYVILPLVEVERSIDQDFVHKVKGGQLYRITIRKRQNKVWVGRQENDVSYYLNNWSVIK